MKRGNSLKNERKPLDIRWLGVTIKRIECKVDNTLHEQMNYNLFQPQLWEIQQFHDLDWTLKTTFSDSNA